MSLIPGLSKQRQVDLRIQGQPGLQNKQNPKHIYKRVFHYEGTLTQTDTFKQHQRSLLAGLKGGTWLLLNGERGWKSCRSQTFSVVICKNRLDYKIKHGRLTNVAVQFLQNSVLYLPITLLNEY